MMNEAIARNPQIQSMRYSLSSRFQAVLLGAALGEILGTQCQVMQSQQPQVKQPSQWTSLSRWGFSDSTLANRIAIAPAWGRVAVQLIKGLIRGGGGETSWINEVLDVLEIPFEQSNREPNSERNSSEQDEGSPLPDFPQIDAGLAIAALPIALFFHADPHQLEQELQQADKVWRHRPELSDGVLAISYALSLALREQLDPTQLIAEIVEELELNRDRPTTTDPSAPSNSANFVEQLRFTQSLNQTSLDRATAQIRDQLSKSQTGLDALTIAIAFHCFLNTPEDFCLSVIRAAQLHRNPQTTCLTAALSGAYNGISSIPLSWRSALSRGSSEHSPLNHLWGVATEAELQQLSDQLLAAWSGAYDLVHLLNYPGQTFAIAAPKVIRPH
ncbi:ADP-ribosylglycohydrolase family protein [Oculatella sp. FACHB-28]|uniref:ADP-ribosylglycohydrolase family protein n=1 Tax=Oculatella sp. FACHB-28 TaxID=2692845 RepID=UPI00168314CB|nr:ADP-ribosylglycohydrolase family protein [Oculatella sp. FACHB-28]MBD2058572.1 ADP-ribosylglycohydrolase family protein [Oculatella sp. FACHB-28]